MALKVLVIIVSISGLLVVWFALSFARIGLSKGQPRMMVASVGYALPIVSSIAILIQLFVVEWNSVSVLLLTPIPISPIIVYLSGVFKDNKKYLKEMGITVVDILTWNAK